MKKNNGGFTLVELIVSIAASVLVVAAVSSFILFGLRMEKSATDNAQTQNDYNVLLRVLENLTAEGKTLLPPQKDTAEDGEEGNLSWELCDADGAVLSYNADEGIIVGKGGVAVVDGIKSSDILYEEATSTLSCYVETMAGESYSASVYCRIAAPPVQLAGIEKVDFEVKYALQELANKIEFAYYNENEQLTEGGWQRRIRTNDGEDVYIRFIPKEKKLYVDQHSIDGIVSAKLSFDNLTQTDFNLEIQTVYNELSIAYSAICSGNIGEEAEITSVVKLPEAEEEEEDSNLSEEMPYREKFLETALSQYGSTGMIYDPDIDEVYEFATWYWALNLRNNSAIWVENPEDIPWCAIFVSWALNKTVAKNDGKIPQNIDALVDNVMWYQFDRTPSDKFAIDEKNNNKFDNINGNTTYEDMKKNYISLGKWKYPVYETIADGVTTTMGFVPNPGDLVFFENDGTNDRADHLGIVLYIENDTLFVVEGNHDDRVGIFKYEYKNIDESENGVWTYSDGISHVIGYGVLDWQKLFPYGNWSTETE